MLRHLFKIAVRSLWKHRGYSAINVVGLAMGMAFTIMILLWVRFEVQFDRFHENADSLYLVAFKARDDSFFGDQTVGATAKHLREEYPEVTHATRVTTISWRRLHYGENRFVSGGRYVDPDFLRMFSIPLLRGNPETALSDPHSIVLTERNLSATRYGHDHPGHWSPADGVLGLAKESCRQNLGMTGLEVHPGGEDFYFSPQWSSGLPATPPDPH